MSTLVRPLIKDGSGVIRFEEHPVVRYIVDHHPHGILNELGLVWAGIRSGGPFTDLDMAQFAQLIGYSLAGYHELDYVSDDMAQEASEAARQTWPDAGGCRETGCPMHTQGSRSDAQ